MRKIWFLMMMCVMVSTFVACSSDDDGENIPQLPVSGVNIPASAAINSEVIIQGSGFTASGLSLYLENSAKEQTKMAATFTSAGVTFVPPMTLVAGNYSVVLKQEESSWTLGSISLTEAGNPIVSPSLPEAAVAPGSEVVLGGSGYEEGDQIILKAEGQTDVTIETTLMDAGLAFTLPAGLAEGSYQVFLVRAAHSWELIPNAALKVEKVRRVKTILLDMGEMGTTTFSFTYNDKGQLVSLADESGISYDFEYAQDQITTMSPLTGSPITFTLQDGKVFRSVTTDAMLEEEITNEWAYSANGQLMSVVNNLGITDIDLTLLYTEGNLTHFGMSGMGLELDFAYDEKAETAVIGTVDPAIAIQLMNLIYAKEDYALANVLNVTGKTSAKVATGIKLPSSQDETTGEIIYDTLPFSVVKDATTLTIDAGDAGAALGMGKAVITYEVVE